MIGALKVPTWFPLRPSRVPAAHKLWRRDILYDTIAPVPTGGSDRLNEDSSGQQCLLAVLGASISKLFR